MPGKTRFTMWDNFGGITETFAESAPEALSRGRALLAKEMAQDLFVIETAIISMFDWSAAIYIEPLTMAQQMNPPTEFNAMMKLKRDPA